MEFQSEAGSSSKPNMVKKESLETNDASRIQVSMKRKRTLTSNVWKHFTILGKGPDGKERGACNYCLKEYVIGTSKYGTSTLNRHLSACKRKPACNDVRDMLRNHEEKLRGEKTDQSIVPVYNDTRDMLMDHEEKLGANQIDQSIVRQMLAMCIIQHDLPFSFVECEGVRELFRYLNADIKFISRHTVANEVIKIYEAQKERLKLSLANIPGRICLTSNVWTSCTTESYICLTAYYVDENWKLSSKILSFCSIPPPFGGMELAKKIFDCLYEWGIEKKIFSLTFDHESTLDNESNLKNASILENEYVNDDMQDILKRRLNLTNSLLCDGEFFHVRCCAHILDLIVQEGLKVASIILYKIRESIKYVKESEGRMKFFEECVQQVGVGCGLRLDVSTRWSSTYMMLDNAIKHRRAFTSLDLVDTNYKHCPTSEEWARGESLCKFLRPFFDITNSISSSSYPTSNVYFMHVWKIENTLKKNSLNEDEAIKDVVSRSRAKFAKYWDDYSIILAMGVVLDPRMKFALLEFCYNKLDPGTCQAKLACVKEKLYYLFEQYKEQYKEVSSETKSSSDTCRSPQYAAESVYREFLAYERQNAIEQGKSSLDLYLEERKLEMRFNAEMDVLQYWKDRKHQYGVLSIMACDVLSIPITTTASDSSFSIGARGLSTYRSRLLPIHVQALLCARNWLFGYVAPKNDGDGDGDGDGGDSDNDDDEK